MTPKPKIAIFHQALDSIGGAEKVCLTLAQNLKADVYTTNIDQDKIIKMGFKSVLPRIKSIGWLPTQAPWRQQLASWRFRHLNLANQYDCYIISSEWAISAAVNHHPNICYIHSPTREIWDLNRYVRRQMLYPWERPAFDWWIAYNRYLSKKYVNQADKVICNSRNTQTRTKTYLGRTAKIVYPPIETEQFFYQTNGDFWLSVNRLINHKRIDIQLRAFKQLPDKQLIIVGSYEPSRSFLRHKQVLDKSKPSNVKILNWVDHNTLLDLYARCRGFITTSKDEDFGMNVVEAMAAGKPVIAPREGGYRETVIDGVTGLLIDDIDEHKLAQAIRAIDDNPARFKSASQARALDFDTSKFINQIKHQINQIKGRRIAIGHDHFDEIGGAEIAILMLARALKATVITTNIDWTKIKSLSFTDIDFISLGRVPNFKYLKRTWVQFKFWRADFRQRFDAFILAGWASLGLTRRHHQTLWYCFGPRKGLYNMRTWYFSKYNLPIQAMIQLLIKLDQWLVKRVKIIQVSNYHIRTKIRHFYNRFSVINYNPVTTAEFYYAEPSDYWLITTRIDPYKRLEILLQAFALLPDKKLIIVGTYSPENRRYYQSLWQQKPNNVYFIGGIFNRQQLIDLYAKCRGLVVTSLDEDFGMNTAEAQAAGKPVIAPREGGYRETVIDGVTGLLIDDIDEHKLAQAIKDLDQQLSDPKRRLEFKHHCQAQAKKFDTHIFIRTIQDYIPNLID